MAIQPAVSYVPTVGKQPLRYMAKDGKYNLRSFLGMVGQFRRFIPKFSKIAEPLMYSMCHMKTANISPYDPKKKPSPFSKGKWVMPVGSS